jgi:hypothetical protein
MNHIQKLSHFICLLFLIHAGGLAVAQKASDVMIRQALTKPMVMLVSCRQPEVLIGEYHTITYGQVDANEMKQALGGKESRTDSAMCVSFNVRNAAEDVQRAFDLANELGYGHVLCLLENPPDHVIGIKGRYVAALYKAGKGKKFNANIEPMMVLKTVSYDGLCKKVASKLE